MAPRDENDSPDRDLDAPTPPGGPLRQDAPDADANPIDPVEQPVQEENAETSLDQPSDGSGGE
jgi:hypothetical protein